MAEEQVKVKIVEEGGQQAAQQIAEVAGTLDTMAASAEAAERASEASSQALSSFASGSQTAAQRIQGVTGSVQALVGQLGSTNRTAGLVSSMAGATAQFAAMGSVLGPAGTVVGGIIGFATSIVGLASANREAAPDIAATTTLIRESGEAAETASERMRDFIDSLTTTSRTAAVGTLADNITELTDEMYRLRDAGDGLGAEVIAERLRTLTRFEAGDRAGLADEAGNRPPTRRGGGDAPTVTEVDFEALARERDARIRTEHLAIVEQTNAEELDLELAAWAEQDRMAAERRQTEADLELENQRMVNEALAEAEQQHQDRILEGRRAMKDAQEELDQQSLDRRTETSQEMTGMFGNVSMAFGKTIAAIATGEKSADEAFKGLAASFLEMISQYATLKAATEFAEAGGAFARYDYGGGAAHIGAGLAFTAVAVATGVGAAALSAPPSAPARPETTAQQTTGGGGDVVINWNSPVVTAGTYAELGRSINDMAAAGASI